VVENSDFYRAMHFSAERGLEIITQYLSEFDDTLSILNALHHKRACLLALLKFLLALRDAHYSDIYTDSY